jgi:hypothetical protein
MRLGIFPAQNVRVCFGLLNLVTASRFFQHYFLDGYSWLDWYRQESLNGFE